MTKHIFTSQSNLELGRNRSQRRLEAQLDSRLPKGEKSHKDMQGKKEDAQIRRDGVIMKVVDLSSHLPHSSSADTYNLPNISFCKYLGSCPITTRKKCMFNFGYEGCNVYKFYERWGRWTKKLK